ncbi:actin-binding Rho-activating protein isoform X1 [Plutella xylostella]|uniref:actin-binding Rho-activating protein isoform X1 n=1 Tax=Plutella xylostella TaxID=51655 RepID=UPI002032A6BE|nr:actin-binding Rho-activating protein isoform X1 [Plutella xylostella]
MSGNFLTIPGDDPIQRRSRVMGLGGFSPGSLVTIAECPQTDPVIAKKKPWTRGCLRRRKSSSLTDLISSFDTKAQSHTDLQKVTAFSGSFDKNHKPTFSKEEYGKPIPGSMTEFRGAQAQARVCNEMKELCQIIHDYGKTPPKGMFPPELDSATKVISFGELFTIYTVISDKLVGILIRTRKHQLTYFEGEVLFQKQDDDVPIFLMMPIADIRVYCDNKANAARRSVSPMPNFTE